MKATDFRAWITPRKSSSKGKWDYRVVVQRLTDGKSAQEKVSGGWLVAEAVANKLARSLGMDENTCL
jgi:hypothetical protein